MRSLSFGRLGATTVLALLLAAPSARAQMGGMPGMSPGMRPGGMGPNPMGQESKEEGPAEEAPAEDTRPGDQEPLSGYAEQSKRKLQIFELDGYLRTRVDYLHNLFMDQGYTRVVPPGGGAVTYGLPPFPVPLECPRAIPGMGNDMITNSTPGPGQTCGNNAMGAGNLRLRLEPTMNVTDQVRVRSQIDVLDNTIMGSTPDSLVGIQGYNRPPAMMSNSMAVSPNALPGTAPSDFVYTTQDPPEIGQNGFVSSIRAKRAWGEIDSEFGSIRFGRMPWHWGRGIAYNDGGCPDCDVGTSVDRVMALTQLYGHQIAAAWDIGPQGYTTAQLAQGAISPSGYQYDLSQNDDVMQVMASIMRRDNPVQLRERIDRGDAVLNYGVQFVYRNLGRVVTPRDNLSPTAAAATGPQPLTSEQLNRASAFDAISFTPDVWAKLYYKALTVEFEGIGVFGRIGTPGVLAVDNQPLTLRQLGWVLASELKLYRESFFIGLETGGATGDQAEEPSQYLNYRWKFVRQPQRDHAMNAFHFSPDYHIDSILFRNIIGTVTNAIYVKPQMAYWFDLGGTRAIGLNGSIIYSAAQIQVSTPGNALSYGVEGNVGAGYRNTSSGIYGGATWGLLFPMGALDRPASIWGNNASDAATAQILRLFMGIRF
jgi:uncharacterized protein (TIGR04551 family)